MTSQHTKLVVGVVSNHIHLRVMTPFGSTVPDPPNLVPEVRVELTKDARFELAAYAVLLLRAFFSYSETCLSVSGSLHIIIAHLPQNTHHQQLTDAFLMVWDYLSTRVVCMIHTGDHVTL